MQKIFTSILANIFQQHIKRANHHDQMGFILRRQDYFNNRKSINKFNHTEGANFKNHMTISIDAEKPSAKDHLTKFKTFLLKTLNKSSISEYFLNTIKYKYLNSKARAGLHTVAHACNPSTLES